jgi:acyl-CoA oxidase
MYHGQDINTSWEGDNNMLLQQTTKYILKIANKLSRGKTFANNTLEFLNQTIEIPDTLSK